MIVLDSESIAAFAGAMLSAAVFMLTGMICCDGGAGNGTDVELCVLAGTVASETGAQLWLERLDAIASMAVNLA